MIGYSGFSTAASAVLPVRAEPTTRQVAKLPNVSRPHLVKLPDGGAMPARQVGTHRRVSLSDVLEHRWKGREKRPPILDELAREFPVPL